MAQLEGIRVKDISTTATTEAADDYYLLDGATNGTRKIAKDNAAKSAITAHTADAGAHSTQRKAIPTSGRITFFGNSIVAQGFHSIGFAAATKSRFTTIANYAIGGANSSDVLAQINAATDVGDVAFLQEGTNDAAQGVSVATHYANMAACIDAIRAKGGFPILICPPPTDNAYSELVNKNAIADRYLGASKGIPVIDPWAHTFDSDGTAIANALSDTVHPYKDVAYTAGVAINNALFGTYDGGLQPRSNTGNGLFGSNAQMLTDATADGIPDGWSTIGLSGATHALVSATLPKVGKVWQVTVNQTGDTYLHRANSGAFSVGDTILVAGNIGVSGSTNLYADLYVRFEGSGGADRYLARIAGDAPLASFAGILTVPANTNTIRIWVQMQRVRASGNYSGVVSLSGVDIYDITKLIA